MSEQNSDFSNPEQENKITSDLIEQVNNPIVKRIMTSVLAEGTCRSRSDMFFPEGFTDN